jgi:Notch-like protein
MIGIGFLAVLPIHTSFSGPCLNKGVCVDLINSYRCDCAKGWTGDHCEIDIDDCAGAK